MSTAKHADFEALSAFVDGEAPEWADHVAGCPQCRATAAELRALSAKVAAAGEPAPAAVREAAIAAALGAATFGGAAEAGAPPAPEPVHRHEAELARFARRRWAPGSWAMPAIAAVVLACLGFAGVILSSTRSSDHETTFAGPALDTKAESGVAGAPSAPVGDLGDVSDAATLRARALGPVSVSAAAGGASTATGRQSSSSANSGAASDAQSSATNTGNTGGSLSACCDGGGAGGTATFTPAPNATSAGAGVSSATGSPTIAPNAIGTRPCEAQARAREPGLGPVAYFATARSGAVPAYVLGFSTGPNVTLLMLAQAGCTELLRSVGP